MRVNRLVGIYLILIVVTISCQKTNVYYIDNISGDNTNSGTRIKRAWASIDKVNSHHFKPGDKILFHAGQTFQGTILLDTISCGTPGNYITISSFGKRRAEIFGKDSSALIANVSNFLSIKNIDFTGSGRLNGNIKPGVSIQQGNNIIIDMVDVSGFQKAGIDIADVEEVKITNVHAFKNGFAGIRIGKTHYKPFKLLSKNIYIGYCTVEDNPGDPTVLNNHSGSGIIVSGTDGALVEFCLAKNNGWDQPWEGNGPIGIWAFHSNNVVIQNCIAHSNKSNPKGWDGGGFDFDGGVTNSVMQYNYSYNNVGPGYGLYQYWGAMPWENNIVRYNISVNDGLENDSCALHLWNGQPDKPTVKNAYIYNNLFINDFGSAVDYKSGDIPGVFFWNNIFISALEPIVGEHSKSVLENNLYWRFGKEIENQSEDISGIYANPRLNLPDSLALRIEDPTKLKKMEFYKLLEGSPGLRQGKYVHNNGGFDFWGTPLPQDSSLVNIGAWQ